MFKFNVGDRVKLVNKDYYSLGGTLGDIRTGDIVIIKNKGLSCLGNNDVVYGFEGDAYSQPNWLNVEKNFELVRPTLKQLLKEV